MASIPCSSDDGNQAVIIVSTLLPGVEMPTQSLCAECAPAFFAEMLKVFTGVDVADWLYSQTEAPAEPAPTVDPDQPTIDDAAADPPPNAGGDGRTQRGSRARGTAADPAGSAPPPTPDPAVLGA